MPSTSIRFITGFTFPTLRRAHPPKGSCSLCCPSRSRSSLSAKRRCCSLSPPVDDHCGCNLPFDPFHMLSSNTADYHDILHQAIGIKSNFSQPWFVHWDVILDTRMTQQDIEERRAKYKVLDPAHRFWGLPKSTFLLYTSTIQVLHTVYSSTILGPDLIMFCLVSFSSARHGPLR